MQKVFLHSKILTREMGQGERERESGINSMVPLALQDCLASV